MKRARRTRIRTRRSSRRRRRRKKVNRRLSIHVDTT